MHQFPQTMPFYNHAGPKQGYPGAAAGAPHAPQYPEQVMQMLGECG